MFYGAPKKEQTAASRKLYICEKFINL